MEGLLLDVGDGGLALGAHEPGDVSLVGLELVSGGLEAGGVRWGAGARAGVGGSWAGAGKGGGLAGDGVGVGVVDLIGCSDGGEEGLEECAVFRVSLGHDGFLWGLYGGEGDLEDGLGVTEVELGRGEVDGVGMGAGEGDGDWGFDTAGTGIHALGTPVVDGDGHGAVVVEDGSVAAVCHVEVEVEFCGTAPGGVEEAAVVAVDGGFELELDVEFDGVLNLQDGLGELVHVGGGSAEEFDLAEDGGVDGAEIVFVAGGDVLVDGVGYGAHPRAGELDGAVAVVAAEQVSLAGGLEEEGDAGVGHVGVFVIAVGHFGGFLADEDLGDGCGVGDEAAV